MRVLLVEDSERLQFSIRTGLKNVGIAVDVVGDGRAGWVYASRNDYDVVILDVMLPQLDGLSILRRLRDEGHQTHVLMLTAKDTVDDVVLGLRAGADDYLTKPFDFEVLLARIEALGRRRYATKDPVLHVGPLAIDTSAHRVQVGDTQVEATNREYQLLWFLAVRQGEVISRIEIEDHLYHEHTLPSSNSVDSAICVLRRKLRDAGMPNPIQTVRGRGYVLRGPS